MDRSKNFGFFPDSADIGEAVDFALDRVTSNFDFRNLIGFPRGDDGEFWSDGSERDHLARVAYATITGADGPGPNRRDLDAKLPHGAHVAAGVASAVYVKAMGEFLGLDYAGMPTSRERIGDVFARYAVTEGRNEAQRRRAAAAAAAAEDFAPSIPGM